MPIVCVGETLEQREADRTEQVVTEQLRRGLQGLSGEQLESIVVAYEPVWAIGTGRNATPDDAGAVCELVRQQLAEADGVKILYGGSVNAGNIKSLMAKRYIDGALVGGASLDPDSFAAVCRYWL
jgi:triosephosphate isomerase